LGLNVVDV